MSQWRMNPPERNPPQDRKEDAAEAAMKALTHLFSSRKLANRAHFRCGIDGPTDFDILFQSVLDDVFGREPNSAYKCWVRRLCRSGLISTVPDSWSAL
jgi:hypothetical protein